MKKIVGVLLIAAIVGALGYAGVTLFDKGSPKPPSTNSVVAKYAQSKIGKQGTVANVGCKDVSARAKAPNVYACTVLIAVTGQYKNACEGIVVHVEGSRVTRLLYGTALDLSYCGQK